MAKTYNDLMVEAINFHHSAEHLRMMRECSEIALMDQYIEDVKFINEHADEFAACNFDEGYFSESVSDNDLQYMMERSIFKKKSLLHKILQGLMKLFYGFKTFSGKVSKAFDSTTKDAAEIVSALNKEVLSPEKTKKVIEAVNKAYKKCPGFRPHKEQPFASKLRVTVEDGNPNKEMVSRLAAGLSNKTVKAYAGMMTNDGPVGPIPITALRKAALSFVSGDPGDIVAAVSMLGSTWADVSKNGLDISVVPKDIERATDELTMVMNKIDSVMDQAESSVALAGGIAKELTKGHDEQTAKENEGKSDKDKKPIIGDVVNTVTSTSMKGMNELYKMINSSIGASMRLYSDYSKYRKLLIGDLKSIILNDSSSKSDDKDDKDDKKEEKKEEPKKDDKSSDSNPVDKSKGKD